jgi:hypothetical protein
LNRSLRRVATPLPATICLQSGITLLQRLPQAQELEEKKQLEAAEAARKAAVDGLASMSSEPLLLWQAAVRLVKSYTSAASVYVINIVDEEQPDWTPPEDPEADAETDDEDAAAAAGADGDAAAEADEGEGAQEDADADGEGGDGEAQAADGADDTAGELTPQPLRL